MLLCGKIRNGLYPLPSTLSHTSAPQTYFSVWVPLHIWHSRPGHPAMYPVKQIISKFSLPISSLKLDGVCGACQQGKSHQLPFSFSKSITKVPLDLLFSDVWGPSPYFLINGNRCYVIFVDHFIKYSWLFPIAHK